MILKFKHKLGVIISDYNKKHNLLLRKNGFDDVATTAESDAKILDEVIEKEFSNFEQQIKNNRVSLCLNSAIFWVIFTTFIFGVAFSFASDGSTQGFIDNLYSMVR